MADGFGPGIGTTRGPQHSKITYGGTTYMDMPVGENPWAYCDRTWDFTGRMETFTVEIPLHNVTTDEHNILTDANSRGRKKVTRAGRLIAAHLLAEDALATDGTNHLTFTVTNEISTGAGAIEMLDTTTGANTTDSDLASAVAIAAKVGRAFTISGTAENTYVAEGDHILVTATVGGTLANQVDLPIMVLTFATIDTEFSPRISRTAGRPLVGPVDDSANGEVTVLLENTSEAMTAGFDWGDQVLIPANRGWIFECLFKVVTTNITTAETVVVGMGSAFSATLDNVVSNAWFRLVASMALVAQTDDGTTDSSESTGTTLTTGTYAYLRIDATHKRTVKFYVNNKLVKTLSAAAWAVTDLLQPVCYVQKSTGTTTPQVTVDMVRLRWNRF